MLPTDYCLISALSRCEVAQCKTVRLDVLAGTIVTVLPVRVVTEVIVYTLN